MQPALQLALDFVDLHRALGVAKEAVRGGVDWLEVGTPLLKAEGLDAVRRLRAAYGGLTIVCDTKTMDAGRAEMEAAAKAGADVATVLAAAADSTIRECIEAGRNYGIGVGVDTLGVEDVARFAEKVQEWGGQEDADDGSGFFITTDDEAISFADMEEFEVEAIPAK